MRDIQQTSGFKKALKRMKARGADMALLANCRIEVEPQIAEY